MNIYQGIDHTKENREFIFLIAMVPLFWIDHW